MDAQQQTACTHASRTNDPPSRKERLAARTFSTPYGNVRYWISPQPNDALPWLVFLPGLTADHLLFRHQLDYFADRANVLAWDPPAHGASRPWNGPVDLDLWAKILDRIARGEHVDRPVLVGQSLGGYIAQVYLELFPHHAGGFVSIDSCPLKRPYYSGWELSALKHTHLIYLSIPWKALADWSSKGCAATEDGRAYMQKLMQGYTKREYCRLAADGYRALARAVEARRPYDIGCPLLVLCGEHDAAGSAKRYNRQWREREGVDLVWVPAAGHNANMDNPSFVNEAIERFVLGLAR